MRLEKTYNPMPNKKGYKSPRLKKHRQYATDTNPPLVSQKNHVRNKREKNNYPECNGTNKLTSHPIEQGYGLAYGNSNKENEDTDSNYTFASMHSKIVVPNSQLDGKPYAIQQPRPSRPPLTQLDTNRAPINTTIAHINSSIQEDYRDNLKRPRVEKQSYTKTSRANQERTRRAKEKKSKSKGQKRITTSRDESLIAIKDIFLLLTQGLLSVNIMCSCGYWMWDIPQGGTYQGDWGWFL